MYNLGWIHVIPFDLVIIQKVSKITPSNVLGFCFFFIFFLDAKKLPKIELDGFCKIMKIALLFWPTNSHYFLMKDEKKRASEKKRKKISIPMRCMANAHKLLQRRMQYISKWISSVEHIFEWTQTIKISIALWELHWMRSEFTKSVDDTTSFF